jgi:hypothetical protein
VAKKRDTNPKSSQPKRQARTTGDLLPNGYAELLGQLKERIRSAQLRAAVAVNGLTNPSSAQVSGSLIPETGCWDRIRGQYRPSRELLDPVSRNGRVMRQSQVPVATWLAS